MNKCVNFTNKLKPENIFLFLGTLFGLLFMFITPVFQVADEPMHLLRACEVSNLIIHNDKTGDFTKDILPNRKPLLRKNCAQFQEFKDIKHYTELFEFKDLNYLHNNSGYSFIMYLPSSVGLKISSFITNNTYIQFYTARFFNLAVWLALTFCAIRITPFKWQFLICALFPMTIYEGMSISADSVNLGFAFVYIGYIFSLAYGKNNNVKPFIFLTLISILFKGVFLFSLLFLLVPKTKIQNKYLIFIPLFCAGAVLQNILSSNSYMLIGDNIDVEARKQLFFTQPLYVIKLFLNTFLHKACFYLQSSIFRLGWLEIEPKPVPVLLLYFAYLISSLLDSVKVKISDRILIVMFNSAFILLTTVLYFLTYSPLENGIIIGTQGRYFIPLHLTFAAVIQNSLKTNTGYLKLFILSIVVLNLIYASFLI